MTKYEKEEFRKWNIEIFRNEIIAGKKASEVEKKYLNLNGSRSCNPERFIYEIATTKSVGFDEKIKDISTYIFYLESRAKSKALGAVLHIY